MKRQIQMCVEAASARFKLPRLTCVNVCYKKLSYSEVDVDSHSAIHNL